MVVESLQRDGIALDYREIQGKPNAVVLEALNWADLVIDQVWSDTPLAGFATEAAQHGCGVLVCGYGLEELEHYVTAPLPPSVIARPENLRDALARLVANPEEILRSGRALQDFVEKQWARDLVAQRWNALIAGEDISSISVDPQSVIYVAGCGAPSAVISAAISATIVEVGPEGLGLENRPDLLAAIAASYSR